MLMDYARARRVVKKGAKLHRSMVVVRVDLRHISDEKKLSYSDVLWQYVKQDFSGV